MDMVIDENGSVIGRYKSGTTTYIVATAKGDKEVSAEGHKIETFRARDGQGVVFTTRTHVNIRTEPDINSAVITQISHDKKGNPETYPCLGKTGEWYKISVKGKVGYARHDLVIWDGIGSF